MISGWRLSVNGNILCCCFRRVFSDGSVDRDGYADDGISRRGSSISRKASAVSRSRSGFMQDDSMLEAKRSFDPSRGSHHSQMASHHSQMASHQSLRQSESVMPRPSEGVVSRVSGAITPSRSYAQGSRRQIDSPPSPPATGSGRPRTPSRLYFDDWCKEI